MRGRKNNKIRRHHQNDHFRWVSSLSSLPFDFCISTEYTASSACLLTSMKVVSNLARSCFLRSPSFSTKRYCHQQRLHPGSSLLQTRAHHHHRHKLLTPTLTTTTKTTTSAPQRYFTSSTPTAMSHCPNPYEFLPPAPTFTVTSNEIKDGGTMPLPQLSKAFGVEGGEDCAPSLEWSGFPPETKSFVVTCFDPDAPTVSGFWHWIAYDIPSSTTSLPVGGILPNGAKSIKNDAGFKGFCGAAPPPGHKEHRYIFCVSAMGIDSLPIDEETTSPAVCNFNMFGAGVLGRAFLTVTYGR